MRKFAVVIVHVCSKQTAKPLQFITADKWVDAISDHDAFRTLHEKADVDQFLDSVIIDGELSYTSYTEENIEYVAKAFHDIDIIFDIKEIA